MKNKKAFQFTFAWLFAILVGASIIFLAIFASTRLITTEREIRDTEIGKEIEIILSPIETNLEEAKLATINLPEETRLFNNCRTQGNFGSQDISISTSSGIGDEFQSPGVRSTSYNKYIFSSSTVQGNQLYVFAKPFEYPFKIADLLFIWSDESEFCFIDPPREIEDEIKALDPNNIILASSANDCTIKSKKVCFSTSGCDVDVSLTSKSVTKNFQSLYYDDEFGSGLLYAAIFSDPGIYECQTIRLMKRASELSSLYRAKTNFLESKECRSGLEQDLIQYSNEAISFNSSINLRKLNPNVRELERKNNLLSCKLF